MFPSYQQRKKTGRVIAMEKEQEITAVSDVFTVFNEKDLEKLEDMFMLEEMRKRNIEEHMTVP